MSQLRQEDHQSRRRLIPHSRLRTPPWLHSSPTPQRCVHREERGFTLFETILSIGILAMAAAGMMSLQGGIFTAQTAARDLVTGIELQQACAERMLGVRRQSGYISVTNTLCSTVGNLGGFGTAAVALSSTNGTTTSTTSPCSLNTCTATITIAKTSGPAAPLPALTLRLSNY